MDSIARMQTQISALTRLAFTASILIAALGCDDRLADAPASGASGTTSESGSDGGSESGEPDSTDDGCDTGDGDGDPNPPAHVCGDTEATYLYLEHSEVCDVGYVHYCYAGDFGGPFDDGIIALCCDVEDSCIWVAYGTVCDGQYQNVCDRL